MKWTPAWTMILALDRAPPCEAQAVADIVADSVENLRRHVVVGQDHRVLLAL